MAQNVGGTQNELGQHLIRRRMGPRSSGGWWRYCVRQLVIRRWGTLYFTLSVVGTVTAQLTRCERNNRTYNWPQA
jgi:hypothetical protein